MDVAKCVLPRPPATTTGDHQSLLLERPVAEQLAGLVVEDARAGRDLEDQVVAGLAVLSLSEATAAGRGLEVVGVAEVAQARLAGVDGQVDGTAAAAVAAVGTAAGYVGLTPERGSAVTAVAAVDEDLRLGRETWLNSRTPLRA